MIEKQRMVQERGRLGKSWVAAVGRWLGLGSVLLGRESAGWDDSSDSDFVADSPHPKRGDPTSLMTLVRLRRVESAENKDYRRW